MTDTAQTAPAMTRLEVDEPGPVRRRLRPPRLPSAPDGPVAVLLAMMGLYVAVFGYLTWAHHANFGTFGFDMGIYDQGIWLMSRFEDPFLTVRGLPYFGHHVNLITVLFVPAYWLGAGPIFLYLVETVALALGAIPLWLLGRDRLENRWAALVPAGAYLMYPSTQLINRWHFHPDALIITPLMFAYWLASRRRWGWCWFSICLALSAKEDAAMAVFVLGLVIAWLWDRRQGVAVAAVAVVWFVAATRVLIPILTDGEGPFYGDFFADFGSGSTLEVAGKMATNPNKVAELLVDGDRVTYYRDLLTPVAFLPLGAAPVLAIGGPQVLVNALSSHTPLHEVRFHYTSVVIAAIFLSTIESIRWLARGGGRRRRPRQGGVRFLCGLLGATALASNVAWSPSPISVSYPSNWARQAHPSHALIHRALEVVPDDAGISTVYSLVPQLAHRRYVYEWPNPFIAAYWGVDGENMHPPERAEYLVLRKGQINPDHQPLLDELLATDYETLVDDQEMLVARRRR